MNAIERSKAEMITARNNIIGTVRGNLEVMIDEIDILNERIVELEVDNSYVAELESYIDHIHDCGDKWGSFIQWKEWKTGTETSKFVGGSTGKRQG